MDNLNFVTLGTALGLITLTLQLIDYRPLRNSFLVLLLIWLVTLTPYFPWPTEDYARFVFVIFAILIMIPTMVILNIMFMKGKDKAVGFAFLSILLVVLMLAMLITMTKYYSLSEDLLDMDVISWFKTLLIPIIIMILTISWSGVCQKIIKIIKKFWKRKKNWRINRDFKALENYVKSNQDGIWGFLLAIVVFLFILLLIDITITVYPLPPESPLYEIFVIVNIVALILGLILIFHSSLLNDDPNWPHGKKEKNGEKESKGSILFIKLLLSLEMLMGVVCILISINNIALFF